MRVDDISFGNPIWRFWMSLEKRQSKFDSRIIWFFW